MESRLTATVAQKSIREWSRFSTNVILSDHARTRMAERGVPADDVFRVLRRGCLAGGPDQVDYGEWRCRMALRVRGERTVGVVVILLRDSGRLFVKTVDQESAP